jgi:hypothetical protein
MFPIENTMYASENIPIPGTAQLPHHLTSKSHQEVAGLCLGTRSSEGVTVGVETGDRSHIFIMNWVLEAVSDIG